MKKLIIFLMIGILLINISQVYAFFPKSHLSWTIDDLKSVDSAITQRCRPYEAEYLDGETGSDVGVLHYGEAKSSAGFQSYQFFHTKAGYLKCLGNCGQFSGSANDKCFCRCLGIGTHVIQDSFSHLKDGIVEQCLSTYFGTNYYGHMVCERDFENKHIALLKSNGDYAITSGKLGTFDGGVLNTFFIKDNQYITNSMSSIGTTPSDGLVLWNTISGFDMTNDARIFREGYLSKGFYNAGMSQSKLSLPGYFFGISWGLVIIGLGIFFLFIFYGKTKWKFVSSIIFLIIGLVGLLILYSFNPTIPLINKNIQDISGVYIASWQIVTKLIEIPPKYGILTIPNDKVVLVDQAVRTKLKSFLESGTLDVVDATGFGYPDANGVWQPGALEEAEKPSVFLFYTLAILFLIFMMGLILQSFNLKPNNKLLKGSINIITWTGTIILFVLMLLIVYGLIV